MNLFMVELALVLGVLVLFGYLIGYFAAKAKLEEHYQEKVAKMTNIINEKNSAIIKIKGDLRVLQRLHENYHGREYDLQQALKKRVRRCT